MDKFSHVLFCHRCGAVLRPGKDNFYVVRIEAFADPTPPYLTEADLAVDIDEAIEQILEEIRNTSEAELMDQVYRRLTIHLCAACYADWIENPAS
ncbi:MAG: hypothetical protein SVV80_05585 [Planctomycetota bacterium]|nr:hypothetical protein [Planctomycetota bacterium]